MTFRSLICALLCAMVLPHTGLAEHLVVQDLRLVIGEDLAVGCGLDIAPQANLRIVGVAVRDTSPPFVWDLPANSNTGFTTLLPAFSVEANTKPVPVNGIALGINANNVIVGNSESGQTTIVRDQLDELSEVVTLLARDNPEQATRLPRHPASWAKNKGSFAITALEHEEPLLDATANDINDAGNIVGEAETVINGDFEYFTQSLANDKPVIDGMETINRPIIHAVRWQNSTRVELTTDPNMESKALATNNHELAVGWQQVAGTVDETRETFTRTRPLVKAMLWQQDNTGVDLQDTAGFPGTLSMATDINENDQIVGWVSATPKRQAFIYQDGVMTLIHDDNSVASEATAINNQGQVVGILRSGTDLRVKQGFFWDGQEVIPINQLLGQENITTLENNNLALLWDVTDIYSIDDNGVMAGCAISINGGLTPVFIAPAAPDLEVKAAATPNPVTAGNVLRYNVPVANVGQSSAFDVMLHVTLPANADYISAKPSKDGSCMRSGNNLDCRLGYTPKNFVNLVQIKVRPTETGHVKLFAEVSSSEQEINLSNNSATTQSEVEACFIATATYGSYLHPAVHAFRAFRDRVLLNLPGGDSLVRQYYRLSPPLATYIREHAWARWISLALLTPLALAVQYPLPLMVILTCWLWIRVRSRTRVSIDA